MKTYLFLLSLLFCASPFCFGQKKSTITDKIDFAGFVALSDSLQQYRESRLVLEKKFLKLRKKKNTIVLDTRSKQAYDRVHVKGAIHLNFSDFTADKLQKIIPKKNTRILIYCNNNFQSTAPSLMDKSVRLALNIPTFINLYGYGYKNIYELRGYIKEQDTKIPLIKNTDF